MIRALEIRILVILQVFSAFEIYCGKMEPGGLSPNDPSSFSRPEFVKLTHIHLNLSVDFEQKILSGRADLSVEKVDANATEIVLDISDLNIKSIYESNKSLAPLNFTIGENIKEFGSKLTVTLPNEKKSNFNISVEYATSPNASGLAWLTPDQTAGQKYPYMFSQFQAIHARSVLPCQDTPSVKTTYSADIMALNPFTVLMSAVCTDKKNVGDLTCFTFEQKIPVQSYLIAFAVGLLESRQIGPRSKVWAEKEVVDAAAFEFANTEEQLRVAEEICGKYVWGIYDILVLPPSFPFGGMENPCLTFATPTLLAGDRSLANVIAHEISHSWTGNLVTNFNFEHFWLNEGFTVFIERKILGRLEGSKSQDFHAWGGLADLTETVNRLGPTNNLTCLVVDLKGVHPDDAFSVVPYEKGHAFLRYIEEVVGGPQIFEPFLRSYFETYKYKSVTTDDFKLFFESHFKDNKPAKEIDWQTWLHVPGMPPALAKYNRSMLEACDEIKNNIEADFTFKRDDLKTLTASERIYILQKVFEGPALSPDKLEKLGDVFELREVKNCELKFWWLRICVKAMKETAIEESLKWITDVGRMKYVRPLYRDLYAWEAARQRAIDNFLKNRHRMMHVVAYTVAKDLHLD